MVSEKLLIFGGPYGNLEAIEALFAEAEKLGVMTEQIICTGDLVAYCADPLESSRFLREKDIRVIQGNCEQSLAAESKDCGCGFDGGSKCEVLSHSWFSYCQSHIDTAIREWFSSLPEQLRFRFGNRDFVVVHGSPSSISEFVFASDPEERFNDHFQNASADCVIGGHCGLPFTKLMNDKCWHNPGVQTDIREH